MSDSCNPIDCQSPRLSARLLRLWDSPGKNTGAGCHFHLQGISLTQESNPSLLHCRQSFYWLSYKGSPWEPSLRGKGVMTTLASPGCPGVSWGSGFLLPSLCQGVFTEGDASPWMIRWLVSALSGCWSGNILVILPLRDLLYSRRNKFNRKVKNMWPKD